MFTELRSILIDVLPFENCPLRPLKKKEVRGKKRRKESDSSSKTKEQSEEEAPGKKGQREFLGKSGGPTACAERGRPGGKKKRSLKRRGESYMRSRARKKVKRGRGVGGRTMCSSRAIRERAAGVRPCVWPPWASWFMGRRNGERFSAHRNICAPPRPLCAAKTFSFGWIRTVMCVRSFVPGKVKRHASASLYLSLSHCILVRGATTCAFHLARKRRRAPDVSTTASQPAMQPVSFYTVRKCACSFWKLLPLRRCHITFPAVLLVASSVNVGRWF